MSQAPGQIAVIDERRGAPAPEPRGGRCERIKLPLQVQPAPANLTRLVDSVTGERLGVSAHFSVLERTRRFFA